MATPNRLGALSRIDLIVKTAQVVVDILVLGLGFPAGVALAPNDTPKARHPPFCVSILRVLCVRCDAQVGAPIVEAIAIYMVSEFAWVCKTEYLPVHVNEMGMGAPPGGISGILMPLVGGE